MRILHLADRWTDRGGAYRHLQGVVEHQSREHSVTLAVGRAEGTMPSAAPVRVVPGLESRTREAASVESLVEDVRPDVVHFHNVLNPEALERVGRMAGLVRVVTVQDHRFFCPARGKWTAEGAPCRETTSRDLCASCFSEEQYFGEIYALTRERLEALSRFRVVVLSRYMKRELVAAGLDEEAVHVVPPFVHGLDLEAAACGPRSVLFAGRLVESKGVRDAVAVWRLSEVELPLVVAGAGPAQGDIDETGIEWLGWVPHERLAAVYRSAAALLMPSRWQEPFGIAGLEALTMGTPVVAWESGGVSDWHPGPLVEWGDVEGLASELRRAVGRTARPPAGFDEDSSMRRLSEVYGVPNTALSPRPSR